MDELEANAEIKCVVVFILLLFYCNQSRMQSSRNLMCVSLVSELLCESPYFSFSAEWSCFIKKKILNRTLENLIQ